MGPPLGIGSSAGRTEIILSVNKPMRPTVKVLILVIVILNVLARVIRERSGPAVERHINQLIGQMTLAEKLGQLQQLDGDYRWICTCPSISRWPARDCLARL